MTRTGYVWDAGYLGYTTSSILPEGPRRAEALSSSTLLGELEGLASVAVDAALGLPWVRRVHHPTYVDMVRDAFRQGRKALDRSRETVVREDMYDVALLSAAGALSLVRAVSAGDLDNGFAAIRPPGHHAASAQARGFCVFNNVAVAARFAQEAGHRRILIVDWDVHPADGTSDIFFEDPDVHVVSVHQDGIFSPEVGRADQRGRGPGYGTTYNLPLAEGSDETVYLRELTPLLEDAAERCQPDFVLISCGFDAHAGDPLGQMRLTDASYRRLTREVRAIADHYAGGRLVSLLEGGYELNVLRRCVRIHLETLME